MEFLNVIFIAFALSIDAFSVSFAAGVGTKKQVFGKAAKLGVFCGGTQMAMAGLGYGAGQTFRAYVAAFGNWVAFVLLIVVGLKMIYGAVHPKKIERDVFDMSELVLLSFALVTSIDALAVGISFSFLSIAILFPGLIIGLVAFLMSFLGVFLGYKSGKLFGNKIEILGGLILILTGIRILMQNSPG